MKKLIVVATMAVASLFAQAASLAESRAEIGACIADPAKMTATMKQLPAADQAAFLAEVNDAIAKMPGSNEAKAATYLNVNAAALKGAAKDNLSALVAEVFATVPPEALTVVNERLAADAFNRSADPSVTYTDEQFTKIAEMLVTKVAERTSGLDNGAARTTFAILMMVRASNGSPADLTETLISKLPADAQAIAREEWIPAALGQNQPKSYEPILGGADSEGTSPAFEVVIRMAGPQLLESMLGQLVEGTPVITSVNEPDLLSYSILDENLSTTTMTEPVKGETYEPIGYQGQIL